MKLSVYAKKHGLHIERLSAGGKTASQGLSEAFWDDRLGRIVTEIGSGVNDSRRKFLALLSDPKVSTIVVEHQDRATRFGFRYLEMLLSQAGRTIEVANLAEHNREELLQDLSSIVYSMCVELYGHRRAKRKQALIGKILANREGREEQMEP